MPLYSRSHADSSMCVSAKNENQTFKERSPHKSIMYPGRVCNIHHETNASPVHTYIYTRVFTEPPCKMPAHNTHAPTYVILYALAYLAFSARRAQRAAAFPSIFKQPPFSRPLSRGRETARSGVD